MLLYASFTQFLVRVRQVGVLFPNPKFNPYCFAVITLNKILRFVKKYAELLTDRQMLAYFVPLEVSHNFTNKCNVVHLEILSIFTVHATYNN